MLEVALIALAFLVGMTTGIALLLQVGKIFLELEETDQVVLWRLRRLEWLALALVIENIVAIVLVLVVRSLELWQMELRLEAILDAVQARGGR